MIVEVFSFRVSVCVESNLVARRYLGVVYPESSRFCSPAQVHTTTQA